jgi:hypothetical protein
MRLSEAIRLGAMSKPQGFKSLNGSVGRPIVFSLFGETHIGTIQEPATCALGAAMDAAGCFHGGEVVTASEDEPRVRGVIKAGTQYVMVQPLDEWRQVLSDVALCPVCQRGGLIVQEVIQHINDDHRWTREQIADWVEGRERIVDEIAASLVSAEAEQARSVKPPMYTGLV